MSSFICGAKHFNCIENTLLHIQCGNNRCLYSFNEYFDVRNMEEEIKSFVGALRKLQVLCVSLQYKQHYVGKLDKEIEIQTKLIFKRTEFYNLSDIQLFKSIQCIEYQIEIEHLKELRELTEQEKVSLELLTEIRSELAERIINKTEEYQQASWRL